MNDHDKDNLEFLMSISKDTLLDWFDQASDDDVAYALELVKRAQVEVLCELLNVEDQSTETALAEEYLQKFRINK